MKTLRLAHKLTPAPWSYRALVRFEVTNLRRGLDAATACGARAWAASLRAETGCCAARPRRRLDVPEHVRGRVAAFVDPVTGELSVPCYCRFAARLRWTRRAACAHASLSAWPRCADPWRPRDAAVRAALAAAERMPSVKSAEGHLHWTRGRYVISLLFKVFPNSDRSGIARALRAWVRHVARDLGLRGRLVPQRVPW